MIFDAIREIDLQLLSSRPECPFLSAVFLPLHKVWSLGGCSSMADAERSIYDGARYPWPAFILKKLPLPPGSNAGSIANALADYKLETGKIVSLAPLGAHVDALLCDPSLIVNVVAVYDSREAFSRNAESGCAPIVGEVAGVYTATYGEVSMVIAKAGEVR